MMTNSQQLTQDRLKELLDFNEQSGLFYWKVMRSNKVKPGSVAGRVNGKGYVDIKIDYKTYQSHRLVWLWFYGVFPDGEIDHINHITTDNRPINLRVVSRKENCHNMPMYKNNSSGVAGVSKCKSSGKYKATITVAGRYVYLGVFGCIEDAAKARSDASEKANFHYNHGSLCGR